MTVIRIECRSRRRLSSVPADAFVAVTVRSVRLCSMTSSIDSLPINTLQGDSTSLADFGGKAILAVNVASKCGLTPQYTGLEALHEQYTDRGFTVVGLPVQPVRCPGARHGRGDRDVLFDHLRRHVPDDGEDRRERRRSQHPIYAELTQVADAEGAHRRHPLELREVPDRPRRFDHPLLTDGHARTTRSARSAPSRDTLPSDRLARPERVWVGPESARSTRQLQMR